MTRNRPPEGAFLSSYSFSSLIISIQRSISTEQEETVFPSIVRALATFKRSLLLLLRALCCKYFWILEILDLGRYSMDGFCMLIFIQVTTEAYMGRLKLNSPCFLDNYYIFHQVRHSNMPASFVLTAVLHNFVKHFSRGLLGNSVTVLGFIYISAWNRTSHNPCGICGYRSICILITLIVWILLRFLTLLES